MLFHIPAAPRGRNWHIRKCFRSPLVLLGAPLKPLLLEWDKPRAFTWNCIKSVLKGRGFGRGAEESDANDYLSGPISAFAFDVKRQTVGVTTRPSFATAMRPAFCSASIVLRLAVARSSLLSFSRRRTGLSHRDEVSSW